MGVYPVEVGSHQVFINNRPNLERGTFMPRPKAVIIAGLGEEGKLRSADLVQSVCRAVIAWSQRLAERRRSAPSDFELASTLLGSGGTGISAGEAARLIAEGVYRANGLLADADDEADAETGADNGDAKRAPGAARQPSALHRVVPGPRHRCMAVAASAGRAPRRGRYAITDYVKPGTGGLQRPPDLGYRGAEFDFISVASIKDEDGSPAISYTLDTRRARSEVTGKRAQSGLIRELVTTASNDRNNDPQIGRTLFGLLIPIELEAYLAGSGELQIELDPQTAAIPWELLDTTRDSDESNHIPWAIRVNLLRKLRSDGVSRAGHRRWRRGRCPDHRRAGVPAGISASLRRTRRSARGSRLSLRPRVRSAPTGVNALISEDATQARARRAHRSKCTARAAVADRAHRRARDPWGERQTRRSRALERDVPRATPKSRACATVPELVFLNCCHLGAADAGQVLRTYDRAEVRVRRGRGIDHSSAYGA